MIGLGRIGAFHAETLTALDAVDQLVVTDPVPAAVQAAVDRFRATPIGSTEELWRAGLDGVVIASSTATHLDLLRGAVTAGVPVFCEKPVAEDPYAARDLPDLVRRSGVPVQIGFPRRFDPAFVAAKAELDAGRLGWLTTVRSTTMDPAPPPMAYIATSGGIYRDCAVHDLDAVRRVTGRDVVEVYATGANRGDPEFTEVGDVDTASVLLTLDDGTLGVVSTTRYNGQGYDVRLELHGSEGSVAAGLDPGWPMRSADPMVSFPAGPTYTSFMDRL
ncbi:MAG: Gfo/Idh/MocA family oxidoreductase [Actinomycetes bacterium]